MMANYSWHPIPRAFRRSKMVDATRDAPCFAKKPITGFLFRLTKLYESNSHIHTSILERNDDKRVRTSLRMLRKSKVSKSYTF
jgi:hypothetical protein